MIEKKSSFTLINTCLYLFCRVEVVLYVQVEISLRVLLVIFTKLPSVKVKEKCLHTSCLKGGAAQARGI